MEECIKSAQALNGRWMQTVSRLKTELRLANAGILPETPADYQSMWGCFTVKTWVLLQVLCAALAQRLPSGLQHKSSIGRKSIL